MSFFVWCEIVCEGCATTICGRHVSRGIPRREMKQQARAFGWSFLDDGSALCQRCTSGRDGLEREDNPHG